MASLRELLRQVAQQTRQKASAPLLGAASLCLLYSIESEKKRLGHATTTTTTSSSRSSPFTATSLKGSFLDEFCHHPWVSCQNVLKLTTNTTTTTASCEGLLEVETAFPQTFNESDRFFQVLEYHRTLLPDYRKRWGGKSAKPPPAGHKSWPRKIPTKGDIAALEMDLKFCQRSPNYRNKDRACQDLQFRIGTYYVSAFHYDKEMQMKGYRMIKSLAENGHPDGMCYYGEC